MKRRQNFVLEHPKHANNTSIDVVEISIQTDSKTSSDISIQTLETSKSSSSTQTPQVSSKEVKSTQTSPTPVQIPVTNVTQTPTPADTKTKVKSNCVSSSVPESPMKNSFNIHSLIGSDPFPSVPDALIQGHTSSNQILSINHPIQVPKQTQNPPAPEVKLTQPVPQPVPQPAPQPAPTQPNNWQPWSTTESKNNSISDKVKTTVLSSSPPNSTQSSTKIGTKRKANHLIEHVVGTQPSSKSSYGRSETKDQAPVRTDNQIGTSRGITFPEPKLGVHKLKTSKSAQIWSHVSSSGSNKKPNSNQQSDQRSRVEHHKSRQSATINPSSMDPRTGAGSERTRQNDRTERSNIDQINFSINSLFADMNTMDDPFTLVSQSGKNCQISGPARLNLFFSESTKASKWSI